MHTNQLYQRPSRWRRCRHVAAAGAAAALLGEPLAAALWESPRWAATGELRVEAGYDTNLNARRENIEDGYLQLAPAVTLSRRGSATRLDITGGAEGTYFIDDSGLNSLDPSLHVRFEQPWLDDIPPTLTADLRVNRATGTNTDLARRVTSHNAHFEVENVFRDTGRTVLRGSLRAHSSDFREDELNTNQALGLEAEVGYAVNELVHVGFGYGHEWGRSLGRLDRGDTTSNEDRLTLRARGELLPKVTGYVHGGVAFIDYDGAVNRSDTAWVGGVALEWRPVAGLRATMRAARYADFVPQGDTALRSTADFEIIRELGRGFSLLAGTGVSQLDTTAAVVADDAFAVSVMAGLEYRLTDRFSAGVSDRWTQQYADRAERDYERHQIAARAHWRF